MDSDFIKSSPASPEDQMDMFMMMMQMENYHQEQHSNAYLDHIDPNMNFTIDEAPHHHTTNNNAASPFSISGSEYPTSLIPFSNNNEYTLSSPPSSRNSPENPNSMAAMREMIFRIAAMQPIHIDPESVKPPKRRNVKISTDPQSIAARHRRERISERIRILQRLVPGGTKMDTASMLDEAIHYVKFLKNQVHSLERVAANKPIPGPGIGFPVPMSSGNNGYYQKGYSNNQMAHNVKHLDDDL